MTLVAKGLKYFAYAFTAIILMLVALSIVANQLPQTTTIH